MSEIAKIILDIIIGVAIFAASTFVLAWLAVKFSNLSDTATKALKDVEYLKDKTRRLREDVEKLKQELNKKN